MALNTRSRLTIILVTALCLGAFCGGRRSVSASSKVFKQGAGFLYKGFVKGHHRLVPIHAPEVEVDLLTDGIVLGEDTTRYFLCDFGEQRSVRWEGTIKYINVRAKLMCEDGAGKKVEFLIRHTIYMRAK